MALTCTIDRDDNLALLEGSARLDLNDWIRALERLLADPDPDASADLRVILDRRRVTSLDGTAMVDQVLWLFDRVRPRLDRTLWAMVVGDAPASYGMARMLATRASAHGVEMRVFTDPAQARAWLDGQRTEVHPPHAA